MQHIVRALTINLPAMVSDSLNAFQQSKPQHKNTG